VLVDTSSILSAESWQLNLRSSHWQSITHWRQEPPIQAATKQGYCIQSHKFVASLDSATVHTAGLHVVHDLGLEVVDVDARHRHHLLLRTHTRTHEQEASDRGQH